MSDVRQRNVWLNGLGILLAYAGMLGGAAVMVSARGSCCHGEC